MDEIAKRWGCTRSAAIGKLVDAIADEEVMAVVEEVTYRWLPSLPAARRFRLVRAFTSVIGVVVHDYARGQVFDRDTHGEKLIRKLYKRGAALVPID